MVTAAETPQQIARLWEALRDVPRTTEAGAHIYPAAAPAFEPAPRAVRPRPDHPHLRLYVHVPFCRYRCSFCHYTVKVTQDRARMERYVDALRRELEWVEPGTPLAQLFVGGGTPTALPPDLLARTLSTVFERTSPHGDNVHACEASPETVTAEHARVLAENGIGRVSMGVQSLQAPVLEAVRRDHDEGTILRAVEVLLAQGLILSVDLMYGLPRQTEEDFRRDVARLSAAGVQSFTVYDLRVGEGTSVARSLKEEERLSLARLMGWRRAVKQILGELGYTQTRWHTFKRLDGPAARHERAPYHTPAGIGFQLGVGVSARSQLGATVYRNHRGFDTYLERIEAGESPVEDVFELGDWDRRLQHVASRLGDGKPLDAGAYQAAFGVPFEHDYGPLLQRLIEAGALEPTASGYALSEAGELIHDLVTVAFYPERIQDWLRARQRPRIAGAATR